MDNDDCPARVWARNATPEDVERLMLDRARLVCARAALAQSLASLARGGQPGIARMILDRFDAALAREIRIEDLTTASVDHPAVRYQDTPAHQESERDDDR